MPNKRVKFEVGGTPYELGTMNEFVSIQYQGNAQTRIIPRAKGVYIWSGADLGGGVLTFTVHIFTVHDTRIEFEQFVNTLIGNIANKKGDLIIEDPAWTLTDCFITDISTGTDNFRWGTMTITFIKSL